LKEKLNLNKIKENINMSFREEVNRTKQFAEKNGTLINQVRDEILKGAARGLSSIFIPLESKNGADTQKIIQFLKEEGFKYYLKYDEHQETRENYLDPHMGYYHEAVARNGGSSIVKSVVTVSEFKGIIIYI
jgi:hypothetical protein